MHVKIKSTTTDSSYLTLITPSLEETSPVNTFQILITPFSRPVARSRLLFAFDVVVAGRAAARGFGGLGPKARPHTG